MVLDFVRLFVFMFFGFCLCIVVVIIYLFVCEWEFGVGESLVWGVIGLGVFGGGGGGFFDLSLGFGSFNLLGFVDD